MKLVKSNHIYFVYGFVSGIIFDLLIILYELIILKGQNGLGSFTLAGLPLLPGLIIMNMFNLKFRIIMGMSILTWFSLLFYFLIGFLIGILVYKLYLMKK